MLLPNKNLPIIDNGIYIASKKDHAVIALEDKINHTTAFWDYFQFQKLLFNIFEWDRVNKICQLLTEGNQLMIDFEKEKIFTLIPKEVNYLKSFWAANASKSSIEQELEEEKIEALENSEDLNIKILKHFDIEEVQ